MLASAFCVSLNKTSFNLTLPPSAVSSSIGSD